MSSIYGCVSDYGVRVAVRVNDGERVAVGSLV